MKTWTSNAQWPEGSVCQVRANNTSTDSHLTKAAAQAVCRMLERDGLGGEGKVFPLRTWVEDISAHAPDCASTLNGRHACSCGTEMVHLCDTCIKEFPTCDGHGIVWGIDRYPNAQGADADKVLACDEYKANYKESAHAPDCASHAARKEQG